MKRSLTFLLMILVSHDLFCQAGVGIGTTNVNSDAALQVVSPSDNKGILIPRMTSTQRTSGWASTPGVMVYDTNNNSFYYFDGTDWIRLIVSPQKFDVDMAAHKIVNLQNGTNPGDAVNKAQLDTKLNLAGGTMTGEISMGANKITNVANAVNDGDAVSKGYLNNVALHQTLNGTNVEPYSFSGSFSDRIPTYSVGLPDFNTLTRTGMHFGRGAFPLNSPLGGEDHIVFVQEVQGWGIASVTIYQVAVQLTGTSAGRISMRSYNGTTWTTWATKNN